MLAARWQYVTVFAAVLVASAFGADETPRGITFDRKLKPGTNFALTLTNVVRSSQKTEIPDGTSSRNTSFSREIVDGDIHIDKVDDAGVMTGATLTLRSFTRQSDGPGAANTNGSADSLLPAGTKLTITIKDDKPEFERTDKKPLPDEAVSALQKLFARVTMPDDVFGSAEKKKVGDTWAANPKAMKVDRNDPQSLNPDDLSGTVQLKGIQTVSGQECEQVEAKLTSSTVPNMGVTPKEASVVITYTTSLPTDVTKPAVTLTMKTVVHVVVERQPLGKGTVRATIDSETSREGVWLAK